MTVFDAAPVRRPIAAATDMRRHGRHYVRAALSIDGVLAVAIGAVGAARGGTGAARIAALAVAVSWPLTVAACGGYQRRRLGPGAGELTAILRAGLWLVALLAVVAETRVPGAVRPWVAAGIPALTLLSLAGRLALRHRLRAAWRDGWRVRRVILVGRHTSVETFADRLDRDDAPGFTVAGACLVDGAGRAVEPSGRRPVRVLGGPDDVVTAARETRAHTVIALPGEQLDGARLRALAWELREDGVDLVVAPSLLDVAGSRVALHSVAGLPLLHLQPPLPDDGRRVIKDCVERLVAAAATVLLLPLLVTIGLLVRATSPGPALFRQRRVGHGGREFTMLKFRTMHDGAHARRDELVHLNDRADGLLFKLRDDPRVTSVGRWLRRFSLDELPQLLNVVAGHMSLVGPRPPLPSEVARYDGQLRRRLLVKPGLTGLWQISGRSDLTWDETVRLDLFYVENWSLGLDLSILWRTATPVLRGTGAY